MVRGSGLNAISREPNRPVIAPIVQAERRETPVGQSIDLQGLAGGVSTWCPGRFCGRHAIASELLCDFH